MISRHGGDEADSCFIAFNDVLLTGKENVFFRTEAAARRLTTAGRPTFLDIVLAGCTEQIKATSWKSKSPRDTSD